MTVTACCRACIVPVGTSCIGQGDGTYCQGTRTLEYRVFINLHVHVTAAPTYIVSHPLTRYLSLTVKGIWWHGAPSGRRGCRCVSAASWQPSVWCASITADSNTTGPTKHCTGRNAPVVLLATQGEQGILHAVQISSFRVPVYRLETRDGSLDASSPVTSRAAEHPLWNRPPPFDIRGTHQMVPIPRYDIIPSDG